MAFLGFDPQLMSALLTSVQLTVCPLQGAPTVEAYLSYDPPVYNANHTSASLKKSLQKDDPDTTHTKESGLLMGVTTSQMSGHTQVYFNALADRSGNACVYPNRVVLNIRYDAGVFIASEVKDMECSYKITMAHENQHVRYDIQTLNEHIKKIQLEMMYYLKSFGYQGRGPVRRGDIKSVQQDISKEIMRAAEPMFERMRAVRRARQESLDTSESYRKQSEICDEDKAKLREIYQTTYANISKEEPKADSKTRARKTNPTK